MRCTCLNVWFLNAMGHLWGGGLPFQLLPFLTRTKYVPHAGSASSPPRTRLPVGLKRECLCNSDTAKSTLLPFINQGGRRSYYNVTVYPSSCHRRSSDNCYCATSGAYVPV